MNTALLLAASLLAQTTYPEHLPTNVFAGPEADRLLWTAAEWSTIATARQLAGAIFEGSDHPSTVKALAVLRSVEVLPLGSNRPPEQLAGVESQNAVLLRRTVVRSPWLVAILLLHECEHVALDLQRAAGDPLLNRIALLEGEKRTYASDVWRIRALLRNHALLVKEHPELASALPAEEEQQLLLYQAEAELNGIEHALKLEAWWLSGTWNRFELHASIVQPQLESEAETEKEALYRLGKNRTVGSLRASVDRFESSILLLEKRLINHLSPELPAEVEQHLRQTNALIQEYRILLKRFQTAHLNPTQPRP